jgi:nucleoside-diphosphate-sugar epimerase
MDLRYEHIITGRTESLFAEDIRANAGALREALGGKRIAVVGAAGSIGSAVTKTLLRFAPGALALIDLSENNLVELVRDLRSTDGLRLPAEFATLPIGLGSVEFGRYFAETKPFDYFLNLSAIKHVRTERDVYCLVRMIDTNVLFLHEFLSRNPYRFKKVFSVSSDKATNPANLMGATKMIMEKALLARSDAQPFSTARFANVAFSDGSLPFGFLQRLAKRQPLSAPSDVRRYFISHQEAGELCVLSCGLGKNRDVFFPNLAQGLDEKTFAEIARALLAELGYKPVECASEEEAKALSAERQAEGAKRQAEGAEREAEGAKRQAEGAERQAEGAKRQAEGTERQAESGKRQARSGGPFAPPASRLAQLWPCYFFKSDTTGEKEFEEFFAQGERLVLDRFKRVGVVKGGGGQRAEGGGRRAEDGGLEVAINDFLGFVRKAKTDPTITKADYVREIQKLVPTLQHHETGRNLDQKM